MNMRGTVRREEAPPIMKNLSVSKIEKALLCALAMKYQYVDKIPQLSGWKLIAGNVVHEILENAIRKFVATGAYPDEATLDAQFEPTWQANVREEEEKPWFIGWQVDPDDPPERIKEGYRPLVGRARREVLPTIKPWMIGNDPVVEYRIDLELESEWGPFAILGYIDLLTEDGILADWKTTDGPEVSARALRTWLQFAAYSIFVWPIVGEEVLKCEKIFLVRGEKPFVQRHQFEIGPKHREWFVRVAAQVWGMVKKGIYVPNTESWFCKPGFCNFYDGCQGEIVGKKAVDPAAELKARMRDAGPEIFDILKEVAEKELLADSDLYARMSAMIEKIKTGA